MQHILDHSKENNFGPITAMDISQDEFLVCGHDKGGINIWELEHGVIIKSIKDYHSTAILSIKFWKDTYNHIISSDNESVIYLITLTKKLFSYEDKKVKLIDCSAGTVFSIAILRNEMIKEHPLSKLSLIALATIDKVLVISLVTMNVLYKMENDSIFGLPYLSWGIGALPGTLIYQIILISYMKDNEDNKDPILAVSWNKVIYLLKVSQSEDGSKIFKVSAHFISNKEIIYIGWISKNLILAVDGDKRIKTLYSGLFKNGDGSNLNANISEYKKAVMKTKSLNNDISYQSFLIKDPNVYQQKNIKTSFSNSNNQDFYKKSGPYYSNTILAFEGSKRIFILCVKNFYIGRLSNWDDYIKNLISQGDWLKSFTLCLDIYQGI